MRKRYLIIDKRQRIKTEKKYSYVLTRLKEEILNQKDNVDIFYLDEVKIQIKNNIIDIFVGNKSILDFTHIIIRGHITLQEYLLKKLIINHIQSYNKTAENRILVQNLKSYHMLPYYNKLSQAQIALNNNIPFLDSEYMINFFKPSVGNTFIMKNLFGENELVQNINDSKIKKQIYKFHNKDYSSKSLSSKNYSDFFAQEFIKSGIDYRVYLQGKNILYVVERKSKDSFITVSNGEYKILSDISADLAKISIRTAKAFKSDFIATDIILKENVPYLLEVNLNPGFKAFEQKAFKKKTSIAKQIVNSFDLQ